MYQRILIPVDGSETATKAMVTALQLARDSGGQVHLVHVVEGMTPLAADPYGAYSGEVIEIMRQSGSKILEDALEVAKAAGVTADTELFDNFGERLAEVVADAAIRFNADLIVVGTHGRRGLGRMMLGSGAEQIIRLAPVPVLVIRQKEKKDDSA
ncbi:MAG: universal stress protein [Polaromonas sp.]|jgi:nucleotide-binding universal stress UspA family protein|nr:universal stress protein [Polaromonas sp.]